MVSSRRRCLSRLVRIAPSYLRLSYDLASNLHLVYRTNTFPLIHINLFHMVVNVVALVPLLDRFECEHGTITTLALFFGRT